MNKILEIIKQLFTNNTTEKEEIEDKPCLKTIEDIEKALREDKSIIKIERDGKAYFIDNDDKFCVADKDNLEHYNKTFITKDVLYSFWNKIFTFDTVVRKNI